MASTTELKVQSGRDARAAYRSTKYPFGRLRLERIRTVSQPREIRKRLKSRNLSLLGLPYQELCQNDGAPPR